MNGIDSKHFHRFCIAYGLSIPDHEMPVCSLPRIEDARSHPDSGSQVESLLKDREVIRITQTFQPT